MLRSRARSAGLTADGGCGYNLVSREKPAAMRGLYGFLTDMTLFKEGFMMLRRVTVWLLVAALWCSVGALAAGLPDFSAISGGAATLTEAEWQQEGTPLLRTVQLDEETAVTACLSGTQTRAITVERTGETDAAAFSEVMNALGLAVSAGFIEDLTPYAPAQTDGITIVLLSGANRCALCACAAGDYGDMCWQAVHGGTKLHDSPTCSGMDVARMITQEAAKALGIEDCEICRGGASARDALAPAA